MSLLRFAMDLVQELVPLAYVTRARCRDGSRRYKAALLNGESVRARKLLSGRVQIVYRLRDGDGNFHKHIETYDADTPSSCIAEDMGIHLAHYEPDDDMIPELEDLAIA
jgi:hypothetical protein